MNEPGFKPFTLSFLNILEELNEDTDLLSARSMLFERKTHRLLPVVFFRY